MIRKTQSHNFMNRHFVPFKRYSSPRGQSEKTQALFDLIDKEPGLTSKEYMEKLTGKRQGSDSALANLERHNLLVMKDDNGRLWPPRIWKDNPEKWIAEQFGKYGLVWSFGHE